MYTLNCNGVPVLIEKPLVMGILNYTADSFYAGSRISSANTLLKKAQQMAAGGADIIDIGLQSTRPGSSRISAEEEITKLADLIPAVKQETGKLVSIDTYHAAVAVAAVAAGADIVNDISGGSMDPEMIPAVGQLKVPYVCMHMRGTPETMQQQTDYDDILKEMLDYFLKKISRCQEAGIHDVIIDPGFGFFAKTIDQNLYLLRNLSVFAIAGKPILAGLSRKSTIYRTLGTTAEDALNGTTVLNTLAVQNGASILRVHDVKEACEVITLMERYTTAGGKTQVTK